jgi:carboxymethylenebutenolidase
MSGKMITIAGKDGNFQGYLASPPSGSGGGVVVIQEIFGINPWLRQMTDWFAAQGYFALAPDLFWRLKPGIQLDPTKPEQFQQALDYYGKFDVDKGVVDIQATIDALRKVKGCNGNVGTTGFCLGGLLCFLAAARTNGQSHASYYGVGMETKLDEARKIKVPAIFHLGGKDGYVPPHAQAALRDAFEHDENIHVFIYDDAGHGFARENDPSHYAPAAAKLAHQRTLELFRNTLA